MSYSFLQDGVSIVIVTFNGRFRLLKTLGHLAKQKSINFPVEILIVDNNSNDGTNEFCVKTWKDFNNPFPLRVVIEKKPGTMFARKKGIEESEYRYILYCDDDNWLDAEYVFNAYKTIKESDNIAAVGGCGVIEYENNFSVPSWMYKYKKYFGTGAQGNQDGDTTHIKGCLYTAGAILDKEWLVKLYNSGFKSVLHGRDGKTLIAGEDTELTYALRLIGGRLFYNSKMRFQHFMPENRLNWNYLKKLNYAFGYSNYMVLPYEYYFLKRNFPSLTKQMFITFKKYAHLKLSNLKHGFGEGHPNILEAERYRGTLKAMIFNYNEHLLAKQIILKLVSSTYETH